MTLLVTSHDMDDLNEMAQRMLLINRGKLAFDGSYEELLRAAGDRRLLKLSFGGEPPALHGMEFTGRENGLLVYRYDAGKCLRRSCFPPWPVSPAFRMSSWSART